MKIRKQKERTIRWTDDGEPYVLWGKAVIMLSAFWRELARFVDWNREYWHAMDCTRNLVIHLSRDGERYVLGKVSG